MYQSTFNGISAKFSRLLTEMLISVNQASTEVDRVSIKVRLRLSIKGIGRHLSITVVHMIQLFFPIQ